MNKTDEQYLAMYLWARDNPHKHRPIPGTKKVFNAEVQAVLFHKMSDEEIDVALDTPGPIPHTLTPHERGGVASGLITAKVLAAYKIGEMK